MSFFQSYGGRNRLPGVTTKIESQENEIRWSGTPWVGYSGVAIDGAAVDSGNTSYTHILRAGLLLGQVTSTKKLKQWDPTATDGTEYVWGVLSEPVNMHVDGVDTARLMGFILVGGGLRADQLIIPGQTTRGLSGKALEYIARQNLRHRFWLDDSHMFARPEITLHDVSASEQSSGITLTVLDSHRRYTNTGGAVTITLPSTAYRGLVYEFYSQTASTDNITISSGSSNIIAPGEAATNSYVVNAAMVRLEGDGTNWVVSQLSAGSAGALPVVIPDGAQDNIAAAAGGAISVANYLTTINTDAGGDAFTLADGVEGQVKKIQLLADGGGDAVITPTNLTGGTTITMADAGDLCVLKFVGGSWVAIELSNDADGATAPVVA